MNASRTWHGAIPTFYVATGALITDPLGRVLLVKPTYRDHWIFPGGILEATESPDESCAREIMEELGLNLPVERLLVVDWTPPAGHRQLSIVYFIFDAGMVVDPNRIILKRDELEQYEFLRPKEAIARLVPVLAARLPAALWSRASGHTVYLPALTHRGSPPAETNLVGATTGVRRS